MNRKEIRELARVDLDDTVAPFRWSDAFLNNALNEAEREAARRARLIVDSSVNDATQIITSAGEGLYPLDSRVVFVRRVMSDRRSIPIQKVRMRDLDAMDPGWQTHIGEISHYLLDFQSGSLRTYRVADADTVAVLSLTVVREPMKEMTLDSHAPEIPGRYHRPLRHWMLKCAYLKPDEDTYRPDKAKIALAEFERTFGPPSTAQDEAWINANHGYDEDEGLY